MGESGDVTAEREKRVVVACLSYPYTEALLDLLRRVEVRVREKKNYDQGIKIVR